MSSQRMLKDIPIIGRGFVSGGSKLVTATNVVAIMMALGGCCLLLLSAAVEANNDVVYKPVYEQANNNAPAGKHPVYFSEYKLRSIIEASNEELRQLKRDFLKEIVDNYYPLKSDQLIGYERARAERRTAAIALSMMAADLGEMIVRKHIIQRRLMAGLKAAFVKFLPLRTLRRLVEIFPKSYSWLKHQSQVDLRPKFPQAKENQFVKLYTLIELRARIRAADDVVALTSDNIKRILMTVHWFLVDKQEDEGEVNDMELRAMKRHASKMINFYLDSVIKVQRNLQESYENNKKSASRLIAQAGGDAQFVKFVDEVIDSEALDIELNKEANSLEMPPTINEEIVNNVERRWIPAKVLDAIDDDRLLLLENKSSVRHLVKLEPENSDPDLGEWAAKVYMYLCSQSF